MDLDKENYAKTIIDEIMIKTGGGQMIWDEYFEIYKHLGDINFLVFGTGHDSDLWRWANIGGKTVFLENLTQWIKDSDDDVFKVEYTTNIKEYKDVLHQPDRLVIDLPNDVMTERWDVILVDSPIGCNSKSHGRMQSIYMASLLANESTIIYVHDCHRDVEDLYTRTFFNIKKQFKTLRELNKK